MTDQGGRIGEGRTARAHCQPGGRDTGSQQCVQRGGAFGDREGGAFSGRAEQHDTVDTASDEVLNMHGKPVVIDGTGRCERRQRRTPQAGQRRGFNHRRVPALRTASLGRRDGSAWVFAPGGFTRAMTTR